MNKLIILDRDGVINHDSWEYIKSVDEFHLLPGSVEAIARLTQAGYRVGVATNQSGIARGYYDPDILSAIHDKMMAAVKAAGGHIDAIEYCPHMPDFGCSCRKPKPGMLQSIAKRYNYSLSEVPYVGDRISDIEAALAVGAAPMVVLSPMTDRTQLAFYPNIPVFNSLSECIDEMLMRNE